MKSFSYIFILILATSVFTNAQTNQAPICPTVYILGPPGIVRPNEPTAYTAEVDTKGKILDLRYIWSVSEGEIIEGQDTQTIKIKFPEDHLTITVEVKGFPQNCLNTASETAFFEVLMAAEKLDELSGSFSKIDKARFGKITLAIQNDPTSQLYVLGKYKENASRKKIEKRETEIKKGLIKAGVEEDRITFMKIAGEPDLIEFWLVPAGATPPAQ